MFISLEGGDGAGKSTLCSVLSGRLGAVTYAPPPEKYWKARRYVEECLSAEERYKFYRDGILEASKEVSRILRNGGRVVCDRYWLTTYTYYQVMGVGVAKEDFDSIILPDLTVILALNHEVQVERMTKRGMSVGDRRHLDRQKEITAAFFRNALEFSVPFIVLDTQKFSPEACAEIIAQAASV